VALGRLGWPAARIANGPVSTDSAPSRAPCSSTCEPYRERIEAAVQVGRNAMAIWQGRRAES
jgi:hypothetical protein